MGRVMRAWRRRHGAPTAWLCCLRRHGVSCRPACPASATHLVRLHFKLHRHCGVEAAGAGPAPWCGEEGGLRGRAPRLVLCHVPRDAVVPRRQRLHRRRRQQVGAPPVGVGGARTQRLPGGSGAGRQAGQGNGHAWRGAAQAGVQHVRGDGRAGRGCLRCCRWVRAGGSSSCLVVCLSMTACTLQPASQPAIQSALVCRAGQGRAAVGRAAPAAGASCASSRPARRSWASWAAGAAAGSAPPNSLRRRSSVIFCCSTAALVSSAAGGLPYLRMQKGGGLGEDRGRARAIRSNGTTVGVARGAATTPGDREQLRLGMMDATCRMGS